MNTKLKQQPATEVQSPDRQLTNYTDWIARGLKHPKINPAVKDALQSIVVSIVANHSGYIWDDDEEGLRFMLPRLLFHMNEEYAEGILHSLGELISSGLPEAARNQIGSLFTQEGGCALMVKKRLERIRMSDDSMKAAGLEQGDVALVALGSKPRQGDRPLQLPRAAAAEREGKRAASDVVAGDSTKSNREGRASTLPLSCFWNTIPRSKENVRMVTYLFGVRRCLVVVGLGLAGMLPCAAQQKPQSAPTPSVRLCEAPTPVGRPGRGVGSGSGSPTVSDEVKVVFTQSEVTKKAEVLFKPTPDYTALRADVAEEEAQLRVVLCPKGYVSNIEVLSKASGEFIEKAVEAAREIRFIPAEKDGKRVAQYATVVYSHHVY
jgi:hypothetical protein